MVGGNHAHLVAHSRTENYHPERSYSRSAAEILFFHPMNLNGWLWLVHVGVNKKYTNLVGGWIPNPFEKYYIVKLDHETPGRCKNEKNV